MDGQDKKCDKITIDIEVNLVGKYLSQKIYELNRNKYKRTAESIDTEEPANPIVEGMYQLKADSFNFREMLSPLFSFLTFRTIN